MEILRISTDYVPLLGQIFERCRRRESLDAYEYFGIVFVSFWKNASGIGTPEIAEKDMRLFDRRPESFRSSMRVMDLVCVLSAHNGEC